MDSSDRSLIDRFKDGDISGFEAIVLAYQDRIYNLCRYVLGNSRDAEDAAQEVFIKAYKNMKQFEPAASFSSWLYRIAVNTCIDYKRKPSMESIFRTSAEGTELISEARSDLPSPESACESKETGDAIQKSLNLISKKLRTVIVLKEVEGLSYEEIAGVLEISVGTVKSRISRARDELRRILKVFFEEK